MRGFSVLSLVFISACADGNGTAADKPSVYSDEARLVGEIARRLPQRWFLQEATFEKVRPTNDSEGDGLHIVIWELPKTYEEYKAGKGNRIHLYWMEPAYAADKPSSEGKAGATETVLWHGRILVVPRSAPPTWPAFKASLSSALEAAENDPAFVKDGRNLFIGRVEFDKIHVYTRDEHHGFYLQGKITDRLTGREQTFYLRPWSHTGSKLEGGNGNEYLIVGGRGNDDWGFTAIVPKQGLERRSRETH